MNIKINIFNNANFGKYDSNFNKEINKVNIYLKNKVQVAFVAFKGKY